MHELFALHTLLPILLGMIIIVLIWQIAWLGLCYFNRVMLHSSKQFRSFAIWSNLSPIRILLYERTPRTYEFLRNRLRKDVFTGLPLTLLVIAASYIIFLLGGLIEDLIEAEEIIALDNWISDLIQPYRTQIFVAIFRWITEIGAFPALSATAFVASGFMWAHKRLYMITALWITVVGSQFTTYMGKYGFDRDRPEFITDITAYTASFPSGHATGSMAVFGFIAYAIARELATVRERFEITYWTLVLIVMIGFSRIFLSVHYSSDVAAGYLVGGFWLLVGIAVAEQLKPRQPF